MLAHAGSCLAEIGRDLNRAEVLLLESESLADRLGLKIIDIPFGMGIVRRYQGKVAEARQLLAQGWRMIQLERDRWEAVRNLYHKLGLAFDCVWRSRLFPTSQQSKS